MLAVSISWIAILIVFLSFGDLLVFLYNKTCKRDEQYGLVDTFLLGMCFTLIPLSLSSLWLPSNQYILSAYLIFSIMYWIIRRNRLLMILEDAKSVFRKFSNYRLLFFIIPVISIMVVIIWQVGVFDSLYYHQQNIRWNEEYAVVPGLGNIEHRFGFNSNYLLLSAVFSFRFLFGEAVYSFQALVLVLVVCWIIREIITSGYEIKRVTLLIIFTGYIFIFGYTITATSTDAVPNIIAFYLIAKLLLLSDSLKKEMLFFFIVPISMITFKLSMVGLCLISLYIFYTQIRFRNYKALALTSSLAALIIAFWCIRNVIITGYLVFPFYEIDIFNVDWKMPQSVAIEERDFILTCGILAFKDIWIFLSFCYGSMSIRNIMTHDAVFLSMAASVALSPFIMLYLVFKKKKIGVNAYIAYLVLIALLFVWYSGGPDPRFLGGVLFACIYFAVFLILSQNKICLPHLGLIALALFSLIMVIWPVTRTLRFYDMFDLWTKKEGVRPASNAFIRQYPYRELLKSRHFYVDEFYPYPLGQNIVIYISKSPEIPNGHFVCFDSPFPCTVLKADEPMKYQDISEIEARGATMEEGFRPQYK